MGTYYSAKEMLLKFQGYWKKFHPELGEFHKNWLLKNGQVRPMVKGETVVAAEDRQSAIYIVLAGLLVKQRYCPHRNRYNIMNVALPHMGIFTTIHFYSKSPALGDISCLRSGLLLKIPYKAIIPYRQNETAIDTLVNLLINKQKHQLDHLRVMGSIPNVTERYFYFADYLPHLYSALNIREQSDLLLISESSVHRAKRLYLTRRTKN
ncbi:cyclic nucleotide-binding domain-containing protein [Sphingobacterium paramultivorum]|uniref:hypothetical protein n=1 Tax=Sphingobacterium paramultivorum TaxID=2886510 RepID=UPI00129C4062|nr:hypothetical protein [Sphingobacterium paramultivorum]